MDFGEGKKSIYALEGTEILIQRDKEVQLAAHDYGQAAASTSAACPTASRQQPRALPGHPVGGPQRGRAAHLVQLPTYNVEAARLCEKRGKYCVVNNTYEPQDTTVYRGATAPALHCI